MRKLANPLFILLFAVVPYIALAYYAFTAAGIISAVIFVVLYYKIRKSEFVAKKYLWFIAIYNAAFVFVQLSFFDVSEYLIFFYIVAVPALYAIMSIAYNTKPYIIDEASNSPPKPQNILRYVAGVILLPLIMFLFINIISGLNSEGFIIVILIAAVYTLIYLLSKILFIAKGGQKTADFDVHSSMSRKQLIITAILGIAAPLFGLFINTYFYFEAFGGIFGDFSSPVFFIIAAINGILLVVPRPKNINIRLLMFFFKSVGYTYVLYFFVVFLPYIPLGVIGLMVILGSLIFAPSALAFWQGRILFYEFKILKKYFNTTILASVFLIGIFSLPICFYISIYNDRANLEAAVQYIDDITTDKHVNINKLQRTLKFLEGDYYISQNRFDIFEFGYQQGGTPIIAGFYKNIVMKNQTLSIENIELLKHIFVDYEFNPQNVFGTASSQGQKDVWVKDIDTETIFDYDIGAYRTWVNLKLKANEYGLTEFSEEFTLPEGVYVSDYYLDVFGERKFGMLTDESAALFIYNKIVASSRDPGLLRYIGDNKLRLNVFPFQPNEIRETGFELLHLSGFDIKIGNKTVHIKGDNNFDEIIADGATLLSAKKINSLQKITREPEYNFVIDSSKNSDINWQKEQVKIYCSRNGITEANIYFASYKTTETQLQNIDKTKINPQGGYNLNRAVRSILKSSDNSHIPIIIAVTDNIGAAVLPNQNAFPSAGQLAGKFPESPYYYVLEHNLTLTPYSYTANEKGANTKEPTLYKAANYNGTAIAADGNDKLIATGSDLHNQTGNQFTDAMLLHAQKLNPEVTTTDYIRSSFRTRVLTQQTAFIVLETSAQEKELLSLQEKILNENYEVNNNPTRPLTPLAEPNVLLLTAICAAAISIKKIKRVISKI